ncbi:MAG: hypothetical protein A2V45_08215 [Candidatus Aminicenantes bacterium RBG_19FT_COMBO_58_17]|nr:MAG: hypothetical protein A2V45_08215 [Candidatus Aminicenantes bacterium RBG_19FT_COMBO_58_17]
MYFIKLYHEVLDDPKMGKLPDWLYRRCIEFFLLAGRQDQDGLLPPVEDMLWTLHLPDEMKLRQALQMLAEVGVTYCDDQGQWWIKNFAKRQAASTSTERVRQYRKRERNVDETKRFIDRDIELDIDIDRESEDASVPDGFEKLRELAERLTGLMMTATDSRTIKVWEQSGVVEGDIAGALQWRKENDKPPVRSISQLAGGVETERAKRIQGESARKLTAGISNQELQAAGYDTR